MSALHAFDTLAYTKALVDRGYERDKAEALAEAQREFFVKELASEEFVKAEIEKAKAETKHELEKVSNKLDNKIERENEKIRHEITASENRMMRVNAALIAFAIAAIPIIQVLLSKLS